MEIRTSAQTSPCHDGVYHTYKSILWIEGKESGSFIFGGLGFGSGTMSMEISIDDEHQKKGYSRTMVRALCAFIRDTVSKEQLLFIDTDASGGFWEYLGMVDNPGYDHYTKDQEGGGYEKVITFEKLCQF